MSKQRLLYLGFALPPGVSALHPELMNGGHIIETNMVHSLRPWFEIRSVGVASRDLASLGADPHASIGLTHDLHLLERFPQQLSRWQSLRRLQKWYRDEIVGGWKPDVVLVFNLSPVYSAFVRWLHCQPGRPPIVLFLADAPTLGGKISRSRRFRYFFKPMSWFEEQMLDQFDACVGVSTETEQYYQKLNRPWDWYPGGLDPKRAIQGTPSLGDKDIVFGYLGSLSSYAGLLDLLRIFESLDLPNHLHIAGGGGNRAVVEDRCRQNSRLHYGGNLTPDEALSFAQRCDVLVNPRTTAFGNRNNFPIKIFDYALSGRCILSGRLSGVERALGSEAFYFDHNNFDRSLALALRQVAKVPRHALARRGAAIQRRLLNEFKWADRASGLADFLLQQAL